MAYARKEYLDIPLSEVKKRTSEEGCILIDVREPWEFEEFNIGGINIPLAEIRKNRELLAPYSNLIVVCTNGTRSKVAAMDYCRVAEWQDKTIFHVKGGILEAE